ncbi:DUF1045 domain-containing protein [Telmatospirillum sp.]|uniref:DUF1045 domain-containing protein n=1 Tax=Telmatospirillum sp. TaxID=2079197 RepID=UPI00283FD272|nr:DUF1045 domain-containing protein [Telmatospirillum sp.]MDR3440872.1 DUF1045 domain-containing protein [Telmatospirillum sp.]
MTAYRYAVYAVPDVDHPLWRMAAAWIGRDVGDDRNIAQMALPTLTADRFFALTTEARRYGFHGTLKAPFRLADGLSEGELLHAVRRFAARRPPLAVRLAADDGLGFLALRPVGDIQALHQLADDCVREFDRLRAPLTLPEVQRRLGKGLSDRQHALLLQWGYPYVLDEFRFHMTLADRCDREDERDLLLSTAKLCFSEILNNPIPLQIALFAELRPGSAFQLIEADVRSASVLGSN